MAASTPNHERPAVRTISPNANLAKLPAEIHIEIAEMLEDKELRVLRQVCRALAKDTTDVFAKRFFSKVAVSLVIKDLQRFLEMTKISYLAKWMKIIELRQSYRHYRYNRNIVVEAVAVPLTQSFRNLSLLGAGKSIGATTCTTGLATIELALADSRHVIDEFNLDWENGVPHLTNLFQLIDVQRMQVLSQTWAKLRVLRIRLLSWNDFDLDIGGHFHRLFLSANQITYLALRMHGYNWENCPKFNEVFSLKHLRQLRLAFVEANMSHMMDVVLNGRSSLRELVLKRCTIWDAHEPLAWPIVLNHIADELHLTSFQAVHLREGSGYFYRQGYFCDCDGSNGFKYEGSEEDIRAKMKQLAETGGQSGIVEYNSESETEEEYDYEDWWYRE